MTTMRKPAPRGDSLSTTARRSWLNCTLLITLLLTPSALSCTAGGQSGDLNQDALGRNSGDLPAPSEPEPSGEDSSSDIGSSSEDAATSEDSAVSDDVSDLTGVGSSGPAGIEDAGTPLVPELSCSVNTDCIVVGANNHCCPHSSFDYVTNAANSPPVLTIPCEELRCPPERYFATCNAGQCELVDLQDHRLTACDSDEVCILHSSVCAADCAEDPEPTISLNALVDEDWPSVVCDPGAPPMCVGITRDYRAAACVDGSCQMLDQ